MKFRVVLEIEMQQKVGEGRIGIQLDLLDAISHVLRFDIGQDQGIPYAISSALDHFSRMRHRCAGTYTLVCLLHVYRS